MCGYPKEYCGSCPMLDYCFNYSDYMSKKDYVQMLKDEGREDELEDIADFINY